MTSSMQTILESISRDFKIPVDEDIDEACDTDELDEENTSSSVEGYSTPYAFGKKERPVDDEAYSKKVPKTDFYKKMAESIDRIDRQVNKKIVSELNYNDYKSDQSNTERQKINLNIKEINRQLMEVERMITHAYKLKTESGADNGVFWKGTLGRFQKINEKLLRISGKIREMNS